MENQLLWPLSLSRLATVVSCPANCYELSYNFRSCFYSGRFGVLTPGVKIRFFTASAVNSRTNPILINALNLAQGEIQGEGAGGAQHPPPPKMRPSSYSLLKLICLPHRSVPSFLRGAPPTSFPGSLFSAFFGLPTTKGGREERPWERGWCKPRKKICLPHRSVTSFLRGALPPQKNPESAPVADRLLLQCG